MKLVVYRDALVIEPEGAQDQAYLLDTMGLETAPAAVFQIARGQNGDVNHLACLRAVPVRSLPPPAERLVDEDSIGSGVA